MILPGVRSWMSPNSRTAYIEKSKIITPDHLQRTDASGEWIDIKNLHFHVLQPLFRALVLFAAADFYTCQDSKHIGNMPVFLIRTSIEDGLSAPITLDSIHNKIDKNSKSFSSEYGNIVKTSLKAAIDFVLELEALETAAYRLNPDPATIAREEPEEIEIWDDVRKDWRKEQMD